MENQAYMLRTIAKYAGVGMLREVAQETTVKEAYRVSIHYYDLRARDSVGTVRYTREGAQLSVVFLGALANKPLQHPIAPSRYASFVQIMQMLRFDNLPDQQNIPTYGCDLWLIERAAAGFLKSVIIAPDLAAGAYANIVTAVQEYLPTAVKVVI